MLAWHYDNYGKALLVDLAQVPPSWQGSANMDLIPEHSKKGTSVPWDGINLEIDLMYEYDSLNRLTAVYRDTVGKYQLVQYTYDVNGRRSTIGTGKTWYWKALVREELRAGTCAGWNCFAKI